MAAETFESTSPATGEVLGTFPSSGTEEIGTPGGDFGATTSGTLEMSNVDLATEFTNMISAQRGFQANSRVISTADDMLNDVVNMKH